MKDECLSVLSGFCGEAESAFRAGCNKKLGEKNVGRRKQLKGMLKCSFVWLHRCKAVDPLPS